MEGDPGLQSPMTIKYLGKSVESYRAFIKNKYGVDGESGFDVEMIAAVKKYNASIIGKAYRHSTLRHLWR